MLDNILMRTKTNHTRKTFSKKFGGNPIYARLPLPPEDRVVYRLPTSHPYANNEPAQPACVSANNMSAML